MPRGQRLPGAKFALQAEGHRSGVGGGDLRILGVAFVAAAPTHVARHRQGRAEGPVGAGDGHLLGGGLADPPDQVGVARGAQADVVRIEGGADDVVVAVHRVDAEQDGDRGVARSGLGGDGAEGPGQLDPFLRRRPIVAIGAGVAAGQDGAERIAPQVVRGDRADVALDGLADLLLQAHARHQGGDVGLGARVGDGDGTGRLGPQVRMGDRRGGRRGRAGAGAGQRGREREADKAACEGRRRRTHAAAVGRSRLADWGMFLARSSYCARRQGVAEAVVRDRLVQHDSAVIRQ